MNDMSLTREQREAKLEGMGCKRKRVEDIRFTQGKGQYVDDVKLPGMLHGDFVRSPHAHARVKSINPEKALKVPGVLAVITAETLKTVNLAWMPTLAGDVQMVLADGKVLFQNQEVAFVVATDRYAADDGVNAVEVEYEELPALIDPFHAMDADAPMLREDIKDKKDGAHGPRKHYNHIFEWTVGDKDLTDAAFRKAEVTIKEMISYHRTHPSPLETCQCVCSFDKVKGELTIYGTFQAPHVIRTVVSLIAKLSEQKIHVIAPDIGGGFGNKVGAYPGYICAAVASIVTGKPVKWVEDRIENLTATSFARDYHMTTEIAATKEGKVTGLRVHVLADHGAFDACADPSKWPAGFMNIVTGSYDFPVAHLAVDGVYTNKAPGGVAYRCSFRVTEAAYCIERAMDILAQKLGLDPAELRLRNFIKPEQFPYHSALGWEYDSGDYHTAMKKAMETVRYAELRKEQEAKRERSSAARRARSWASASPSSPRSSARGPRRIATSSASPCSISVRSACTRPGPASPAWAPRARARGTRRPGRRSSPPRSASRPTISWSRRATPTRRPTASAPTARARRRSRAPRSPWRRARSRPRRR
jgi:carbon-monoxide dehydrogenase large subunit